MKVHLTVTLIATFLTLIAHAASPIDCAKAAYKRQTAPLEAVIANVKAHGPF